MDTKAEIEKAVQAITAVIGEAEDKFLKSVEASGLTAKQMTYLDAIHGLGNPNPGEIAKQLGLSKPSVTAILSKLEGLGFIAKASSDEDRRGYHVHCTKKAARLVREHVDVHRRIAAVFVAALDSAETKALLKMMRKVIRSFNRLKE